MALPPPDYFLSFIPAYPLATTLGEIAHALGQPEAMTRPGRFSPLGEVTPAAIAPSHIVVIDDENRPFGAIPLGRLWAVYHSVGAGGVERAEYRLLDCQPWLEPVVEVVVNQPLDGPALKDLGALAQGAVSPVLVVVDAEGQYLGIVNPLRLLGWLAAGADGVDPRETLPRGSMAPGSALLWGARRAWVLELSHALKTPITTLLGLSTLLLDSRVGTLSDRQFRYVSLMRQAIRKLTALVNLLLDWIRLESDQIGLNLERVHLQPLADDLLPSFFNAQPEEEASAPWVDGFTVGLTTTEGWVMADPLRLRQCLHYGLGYLLAHSAAPGGLVIEPWGPWLGFTLWSSDFIAATPEPLSSVEPPREQSRKPFSTAAIPLAEPQSLEGLGLTLARRFSHLHGGELSLLSTPTWGSRITLLLPAPPGLPGAEETRLVLLACAHDPMIDQVYRSLQGTAYRLAVAPSCQTLGAMQGRLVPACTLVHWESLPDDPIDAAARLALVQRFGIPRAVVLSSQGPAPDPGTAQDAPQKAPFAAKTLSLETLAQGLRPALDQVCLAAPPIPVAGLTVLLLRPTGAENLPSALPTSVQTWLQHYRCRLLQVDDLSQASLLSRVWQPQAIILDGAEPVSLAYLQALADYPDLASLPLVTLVAPADETAALALGLSLVACPEVLIQPPAQAVASLLQAIARPRPVNLDPLD
jgi:signal transduction histidine kinase